MKNKKIVILNLCFFILCSCNMSDSIEILSEDYTFVHEAEDYNYIDGNKNTILPNVIEYAFNDDYILVCQEPNKFRYKSLLASNLWNDYYCYNSYMLDSLTEKFGKSRNEILADSTLAKIFKNKKVSFENNLSDIKKSEEITDSIINNNPIQKKIFSQKKVYWIIKIKGDILFGPFTKNEFIKKSKEFGFKKDFNLKN